ncbi:MAG: shikimate kinase [Chitinophagaceae bacterium]|nr:shikimate kinase [Chitinophagaceae bacterium]
MKIFLIGFMGSGKTYWGKIWAKQNGLTFYDLDDVIEKATGKTIAVLFEKKGEKYFRKIETEALHTFADKDDCIIACGGGTACFNDNMQWINKNGTPVYLSASPQYIFERVITEKEKRPLVKKINTAELLFFIEQKLKEREPFYKQAAFILPADDLNEKSLSTLNF